jgi:hypothetical protein
MENLVLGARSEFNGLAGKACERFWSTGVLESMKSQTPSTKSQGVRCQEKNIEPETLVIVIWNLQSL